MTRHARARRLACEALEPRLVPAFAAAWADSTLGPVAVGTAVTTGSAVRLDAAGAGLNAPGGDQAFFHGRDLAGDGSLSARVDSVGGGLMARDGTAYAALTRTAAGWTFQSREPDGDVFSNADASGDSYAKLARNGSLVVGYTSPTGRDGTWRLVGSASYHFNDAIQVGLVGSSGSAALTSLNFADVTADAPPPVGAGLEGVTYYSRSNAFVDLVKQADSFKSADWASPAPTDAHGWATTDFGVILQYGGVGSAHTYVGTYNVQFTGQADISTAFSPNGTQVVNQNYDAATNTTTAQVQFTAPEGDAWYLALKFTNTRATATSATNTGIRDLRVLRPGYSLADTPTFTQPLLDQLSRFSTLRFMDWTSTNNSDVANWGDRAEKADARQTVNGVAWEYVIELANTLGKDLWVNVPAKATDDYVRQLAALLRDTVRPDLAVNVEYSNEVWNGGFTQSQYNRDQATAEVRAGRAAGTPSILDGGETDVPWSQENWAMRRVAARSKQVSDLFSETWGSWAINTRVRVVLPAQFDWAYTLHEELRFANQAYGSPSAYFWATAGAPYFISRAVDDATSTATADQILAGLRTSMGETAARYDAFMAEGDAYGLRTVAYEGGPDTFGDKNIAAKRDAMNDPRMATLIQDYLTGWYANGGALFNWFVAGASSWDTPYGTWGLTDDMSRPVTPKTQGIDAVLAGAQPTAVRGHATGEFDAAAYLSAPAATAGPLLPWQGQTFDYRLDAPQAGPYTLRVRYASQAGGQLRVLVNGQEAATLNLTPTGGDGTFALSAPATLNLSAGGSVVRLEALNHNAYRLQSLAFGTPQTRTTLAANGPALTATVQAADRRVAGGTVEFTVGNTIVGTATVDAAGVARFTMPTPASNALVAARYVGDGDHAASESAFVAVAGGGAGPNRQTAADQTLAVAAVQPDAEAATPEPAVERTAAVERERIRGRRRTSIHARV